MFFVFSGATGNIGLLLVSVTHPGAGFSTVGSAGSQTVWH